MQKERLSKGRIAIKFTIDRFKSNFAVVELDGKTMGNISRRVLPPEVKEVRIISVEIDEAGTQKRVGHIKKLMDDVWAD